MPPNFLLLSFCYYYLKNSKGWNELGNVTSSTPFISFRKDSIRIWSIEVIHLSIRSPHTKTQETWTYHRTLCKLGLLGLLRKISNRCEYILKSYSDFAKTPEEAFSLKTTAFETRTNSSGTMLIKPEQNPEFDPQHIIS